jgi:hypothetical protein
MEESVSKKCKLILRKEEPTLKALELKVMRGLMEVL